MTGSEQKPEMPDLHDPELIATLLRKRQVFLNFLIRRVGNPTDAEDVLQTFSMNVLARSDRLRADSELGLLAWLFAVLRSTLTDHFRAQQRQSRNKNSFALDQAVAPPASGPDELHSEFCDCLRMLLPLMKPDQGDLLARVDFDLESRTTVADDLGITAGALAVRLHRARMAMRNLLLTACFSCPEHGWDDCGCHPDKIEKLAMISQA